MLDDFVNKYKNTVDRTIKMKPIHITLDSYAKHNKDSNETKPKFEVGDGVRISKYKNIFAKGYIQKCSEEVFVVSKFKNTVSWTLVTSMANLLLEVFMKGNCKKQIKKNLE